MVLGGADVRPVGTRPAPDHKAFRADLLETDEPTRVLADLTAAAVADGRELEALEVRRPTLEDVYLDLVDGDDA